MIRLPQPMMVHDGLCPARAAELAHAPEPAPGFGWRFVRLSRRPGDALRWHGKHCHLHPLWGVQVFHARRLGCELSLK
jgi:hypothetical protein